ncbi:MAG: response regulator [Verrucomicrobia bacterium]|nr:response regulator [Verrucomicrobiota bacterium]
MKSQLRILYLEDDPKDAELVQETLAIDGISSEVTRVETEAEFIASLQKGGFDLILADYTLPSFDGLSALKLAQQALPHVPLIFVSGTLGEEVAIEALKIGATDYVFKTRLSRIVPSVQRALRESDERVDLSRAEEALRRNEAYLAEAQKLSHTGSFGWDLASGKIYWSQETFRIFGYEPPTEPTLELVLRRTHPEDKVLVRLFIERVLRERKNFDFEHRLLMPDGAVKYLRVVGRPTNDDSPGFEFVGAVTDISERRRAEEALQEAHAELAHVTRVTALGELTASIAHEINQPLTAVLNNASACLRWLASESPDLNEARESLRRIIRDGNRASDVIAGMRALFKKGCLVKERLDLNEAIKEITILTQSEVRRNKVALQMELARDLPSVMGDRVQIQQVVMNLILNGIEAMSTLEDRERKLLIRTLRGAGNKVIVAVQDSGIGLDPRTAERIFDAFHTTKPGGLGMGLKISRSIIEWHDGRLWAVANEDHGATFQFSLASLVDPDAG